MGQPRSAAAEGVKQLGRPNVAAWTINQLSRHQRHAVTVLLDAVANLAGVERRL
jgi:hypothetical protein